MAKFATGVAMDITSTAVAAAVGSRQFGSEVRSGAQQLLAQLEATAKEHPDWLFGAMDIKNAFGE
eukprot:11591131-Alexandrium_andersonii.AAC.1